MDEESQTTSPPIIRTIEECSPTEQASASHAVVQSRVRSRSIPPFRNLIPQEPLGKVLYRDEAVIRQIYDSNLAQQLRTKAAHDLYEQLTSLEWNPRSDTNFDYLILLLSSVVQDKRRVSDLIRQIDEERERKSRKPFVYPGMPIRVGGVVRRKGDVSKRGIRLRDDECSVRVILDRAHTLYQDLEFLKGRFLFILGIVQKIEEVTIKAGAVLL
jgi:hypothetical protein